MAVPLKKVLARMSPRMRAAAEAEAKRMIAEELTLRELRKAHAMTQEKLAAVLGIKQESVSNLEKRSDMLLSTSTRVRSSAGRRIAAAGQVSGSARGCPEELFGGEHRQ